MHDQRAASVAAYGEADDFVGKHLRVGRGGEGAVGIVGKVVRRAAVRPQVAVEYQPSDVFHAVVAQLRLHFEQVVLVEYGIAAARPVKVAVQQAVRAQRGGGFELGLPAEVFAQCVQGGKGGNELHGGGGIDGCVGAVGGGDLPRPQVLHVDGGFFGTDAAQIQSGGGQDGRQQGEEEGGEAFSHHNVRRPSERLSLRWSFAFRRPFAVVLVVYQCIDEGARVKRAQVVDFFAHADIAHGYRPAGGECGQYAAFGRAVEFGDDEAG